MDKQQKQIIERLENIVYLYNRESRGWHDCNDIRLNSNDINAIEKAIELIKAISSAEPKTGHWIKHDTGHSIYYECSLCGCLAPCTETADSFVWKLSNYCPDCGCIMVEPQESEK